MVPTAVIGVFDPTASVRLALSRLCTTPWRPPPLLELDAGEFDHLGPFLYIVGDEFCKIGGRAGQRRATQTGQPRLHLWIAERCVDFLVELVDDFGGRALRCNEANPLARFE